MSPLGLGMTRSLEAAQGATRLPRPYPLRSPGHRSVYRKLPSPVFPNASSSLEALAVTRVSPRTHTPHSRQPHASLSLRARVHAGLYALSHTVTEPLRVRALREGWEKDPGTDLGAVRGGSGGGASGPGAGACPRRRDPRRSSLGPLPALAASSPQPPP